MKVSLPLALPLLLLLAGCIDSMAPEDRLLCLDLTSKSSPLVPECRTEGQCFSQLEGRLFSFDQSPFSSETRSALYSYKTSVSLSWFYFNKANENISKINSICGKNAGLSGLLSTLNELTHNMAKAFEYSDKANRESFAILLLERRSLEAQDIHLVKEEPLFNDFSRIAGNLGQLGSGLACPSQQSYACFYFRQAENFSSLLEQTGFEDRTASELDVFGILGSRSGEITSYAESSLSIPFIGSLIPPFLSFLSTFSTSGKALPVLQKVPASEFSQSYASFMGTGNSCLSKFSEIIESDAENRKQLIERNKALQEAAEKGILETEDSINSLLSESYASFDRNFFQSLYAGLSQESSIASQQYSIRDFGELREQAESKLAALKQSLSDLKEQDSLNRLTLGKKAQALKSINSEIALLNANLLYLKSEVIGGLLVLCSERSAFIEDRLEQASLPEGFIVKASDLRARTKFRVSLFRQAKETEQKLSLCNSMLQDFAQFSLALSDFEEYELQEQMALSECFSAVQETVEESKRLGFSTDLFVLRLHELQALEKPYPDISAVEKVCAALLSDLESFIGSQAIVKSLEQDFSESKAILGSIEAAKGLGLEFSDGKLQSLQEEFGQFGEFFSGETLVLSRALPLLPGLADSLSEFASLMRQETSMLPQGTVPEPEAFQEPLHEKVSGLASKISQAEEKLAFVERLFAGVSDEQLISAKYVLPITKKEVDAVRLELSKARSFLARQELLDLNGPASPELSAQFDEHLLQVEAIGSRLDSAYNGVKEDALVSYNSAVDQFNAGIRGEDSEQLLGAAQQLLLEGSYLESILASKSALAPVQGSQFGEIDLPVFVWPVAACSALVFAIRLKKKSGLKQKKELLKRIEKSW